MSTKELAIRFNVFKPAKKAAETPVVEQQTTEDWLKSGNKIRVLKPHITEPTTYCKTKRSKSQKGKLK